MSYHKLYTKVLITLFSVCLHFFSFAFQKYPIEVFQPEDYKAGNQNIDFAQNRSQGIFIANNLGVLSYNGQSWATYASNTGKKIRSLAFDESENRLYVGSQGEFGYFHNNWEYVSLVDYIPERFRDFDEVWDVYVVYSLVYFCTFQGIYRFDGESITVLDSKDGLDRAFLVDGKLLAQNKTGQLLEIQGNELIPFLKQETKGELIAGVVSQNDGFLVVYNSGDLEPIGTSSSDFEFKVIEAQLKGTFVNHVLKLSDGRIAISTQAAGLYLIDLNNEIYENIDKYSGLESNTCLRTFQDYEGNLWVGMQNGISLVQINSPIRLINDEINLEGSGYDAFETEKGTYYSTSNGIYFLQKNKQSAQFIEGTEGPAYKFKKLKNKVYACHHSGLFLLENGKAIQIANTNGLWDIKQLKNNMDFVIGGTYSGLYLFEYKNGLLSPVQPIAGFEESSRFFEEDQEGTIWVGQFYKGLYKLNLSEDATEVHAELVSEGNPSIGNQVLLGSINQNIYVSSSKGLYNIEENDQLNEAVFADVIGENPAYLLQEDKQNNVFLITEDLVGFFLHVSANNYVFTPSSLSNLKYYFNNDLLHVSTQIQDGVLFSANEGFLLYKPELEQRVINFEPPIINEIYSVGQDDFIYQALPFEKTNNHIPKITITAKDKIVRFSANSYHFNHLNNQQFRFLLKGFDNEFSPWLNTNTKEYSNLRAGKYELLVETKDYFGNSVASSPVFVLVRPPWYKSKWAVGLYVLCLLTILYFLYQYQRQKFKLKATKLNATNLLELSKKEEEINELSLLREKEREAEEQKLQDIRQQKEQEIQQVREETMKRELEHINSMLAASTMNLVVKNEFIEFIKTELNQIKEQGNSAITNKLKQIVDEIDTNLHLQEDYEQFEMHFNRAHGDFLTRIRSEFPDLTANEQKLCAFLRLNLSTKEIAQLLSISVRGVEIARYRLRKKLDLEKGENLAKFILEY